MKTKRCEGQLLSDYLLTNNISKSEICAKLKLSLPMLFYYCRKEELSGRFKSKLLAAGFTLFEEERLKANSDKEYIDELQEEIRLLTEVITIQKQFISHITTYCKHGTCLNFVLDIKNINN